MWFEIIPAFTLMVGSIALGAKCTAWLPYLFLNGHPFKKAFGTNHQLWGYHRDSRVNGRGNPYWAMGLETIEDKGEE